VWLAEQDKVDACVYCTRMAQVAFRTVLLVASLAVLALYWLSFGRKESRQRMSFDQKYARRPFATRKARAP